MHRTLLRALCALALVAAGLGLPALAAAQAPAPGTPVLGSSLLTPDQITAWYASTGIVSKSPAPVAELAARFIDEGAAQGVRGDIAFAQTMLETGYLRFGGIVKPTDLNFSGLGACDSCPRGLAFPSAELGVRAQIQHLYAYAAAGADPAVLARPLADIRFTNVRPYGKAALWEQMGNGNWATGPDYATKVLTVWYAMLASAGIPVPGPPGRRRHARSARAGEPQRRRPPGGLGPPPHRARRRHRDAGRPVEDHPRAAGCAWCAGRRWAPRRS